LRFLRGKLEKAVGEEGADGEKASHKQVSGTRYQVLGKEVFSYQLTLPSHSANSTFIINIEKM